MVKQLGLPTFFLALSCADLRWNELVSILSKLNGPDLSNLERSRILNDNPVLLARHFQYRVEVFFKEIVLDEFQFRDSPHIHSFLWIINAPVLTKDTKDEFAIVIDQIIKVELPHPTQQPDLYKFVKTNQKHSYSRTCRKYKNVPCRFGFGRFFHRSYYYCRSITSLTLFIPGFLGVQKTGGVQSTTPP